MSNRVNHQEIVKKLLDAKTVNFEAVGKVIPKSGRPYRSPTSLGTGSAGRCAPSSTA